MSVLSLTTAQPAGLASVNPQVIYVLTNDTYATVTATGYLTSFKQEGFTFNNQQMALVYTTDDGPVWLKVVITYSGSSVLNTVISLIQISSPGGVVLPTIANHLIVSTDTAGTLGNLTGTAINNGSLQAGLSGTAGTLISFPGTASKGSLILAAVANTGNTTTTISNAAMAQASVITIPDPAAASAVFLLSQTTGTQIITAGSLQVQAGSVIAGSSGNAGTLVSFPATASNGNLSIIAANAGGNFVTTVSNGTMGQSTVYTIGDIGASTGGIVVATSPIRMKSVAAAVVAGGAASQVVTDTFCTTGSTVIANWNTSANAVTIQKVTPGNGSFTVLSSGDPGASTLGYIITK